MRGRPWHLFAGLPLAMMVVDGRLVKADLTGCKECICCNAVIMPMVYDAV